MKQILEQLAKAGVRVMKADHQRLEGLSGGIPHQGLVALAKPIESAMSFDDLMDAINPKTLLLILDGVTDPRNLGACLRVADATGVQAVVVPTKIDLQI